MGVNTSGKMPAKSHFVASMSLEECLKSKKFSAPDYIINCLPDTIMTHGLFTYDLLKSFNKGMVFINVGRGAVVKSDDLLRLLKEKYIRLAMLDVFEEEPLPQSSEMWINERIIITPHIAGIMPHFRKSIYALFIENFERYLNDKQLINIVNLDRGC